MESVTDKTDALENLGLNNKRATNTKTLVPLVPVVSPVRHTETSSVSLKSPRTPLYILQKRPPQSSQFAHGMTRVKMLKSTESRKRKAFIA
jgi:hypothetical protein